MELADVLDSKSSGSDTVRVRPPLPAPKEKDAPCARPFLLLCHRGSNRREQAGLAEENNPVDCFCRRRACRRRSRRGTPASGTKRKGRALCAPFFFSVDQSGISVSFTRSIHSRSHFSLARPQPITELVSKTMPSRRPSRIRRRPNSHCSSI